jgi:predicted dehydrogenase
MPHHVVREVRYNFEYERRLRACFIGAGGHSYRNIYPAFRYAPVELVAIADHTEARARDYANLFGAQRAYSDYREMLAKEAPETVFIVTSYHPDGRVQATDIATDALATGAHVWMEKPTVASLAEAYALREASRRAGRHVMTGLKKIFFPTIEKLKDIIEEEAFGGLSSLYVRYPQALPPPGDRADLVKMREFLDHIYHPGAIINFLGGPIERASYEWSSTTGAVVANMRFVSGAVGTLHLAAGQSGASTFERVEAVGQGANAVIENGVHLRYYRRASLPSYGRAASFIQSNEAAPLLFEPEHSLGQLYNNNLFYLGYAPEIIHFCEHVLAGTSLEKGTLEEVIEIMKLFEFFRSAPAGAIASLSQDL